MRRHRLTGGRSFALLLAASFLICLWGPLSSQVPAADGALSRAAAEALFTDRVRPLLERKCASCHGSETREGNLDLRTRDGLLRGGEAAGPALVPGHPDESPLWRAVTWQDPELQMPPEEGDRLTPDEIETLRAWIAAGAPWPAAVDDWDSNATDGVRIHTSGGRSASWDDRLYQPADVWAWQPIARPDVPATDPPVAHPIDAFIRAKLHELDLAPAPPADRRTLLRRLTLGLTGLPPTAADVEAFDSDDAPGAVERVIDRLLDSPQYGEQMARHWLDVVRYADTSGFSNDFERPHAWRYRDYVIRSFNEDKPYGQFILEQLAGDELDPHDPELLIAVGFLRMGPWEQTGMTVAAVTRQLFLDDVTNSLGVTFLAQGLRCASCHDHKFDPVPTRDYYRLQAVFAPVQFADRTARFQSHENIAILAGMRPRSERMLADAQQTIAGIARKHEQAVAELLRERGVKRIADLPVAERPQRQFGLTPEEMSLDKVYRKRIDYFQREMKRYDPLVYSVYSGPPNGYNSNRPVNPMPEPERLRGKVPVVHILEGGALASPGEPVTPGVLSAMPAPREADDADDWGAITERTHGRRLALARWVASPDNTLTARVLVNRVWQMHFGTGIVATPNNFGKMGARPSHPELLDWLATWFMDNGWSIRELHRLIVTSATYQQSGHHPDQDRLATLDPDNRLLALFPPRRLSAEEIRDSALALTGELNPEMGGPGVSPEIHWEVALEPRHIMGSVAPAYQPSPEPHQRNRRTIYAFRVRTLPDPLLEVFNRPGADVSCARRDETTVTPQALTLFNGQFAHDRALALAERIRQQTTSAREQVELAFRTVYGRTPDSDERSACLAHVQATSDHHRRHPPTVVPLPTEVRRSMVEELTGEPYYWIEPLDVMKHYQPDLKPWDVPAETRGLAELCLVLLNSNEFLYVR